MYVGGMYDDICCIKRFDVLDWVLEFGVGDVWCVV